MRAWGWAAAALAAGLVAGCGLLPEGEARHPGSPSRAATAPAAAPAASSRAAAPAASSGAAAAARARLATAQRTHEYPSRQPAESVPGGWRTPLQAVEVFAGTYINWTAANVSARLSLLAAASVGQARSAMALAAAEAARDYELRRGGIANSGTVEAVAPLSGAAHRYVVVTRERTSAANDAAYRGLAAAWHVALATVVDIGGLWVLSSWQPES